MIWWIVSIGVLLAVVVFAAALQNRLASARVKVEGAFSRPWSHVDPSERRHG